MAANLKAYQEYLERFTQWDFDKNEVPMSYAQWEEVAQDFDNLEGAFHLDQYGSYSEIEESRKLEAKLHILGGTTRQMLADSAKLRARFENIVPQKRWDIGS